jgi:hypothetical protein
MCHFDCVHQDGLTSDSFWFHRLRLFSKLSVEEVSIATGLAAARIAQIEQDRGKPPAAFETLVPAWLLSPLVDCDCPGRPRVAERKER